MVRYLDQLWPDDELLAAHRREYGDFPFEVLAPSGAAPGGGRRRRAWSVRADGTLGEYSDQQLDDDGELVLTRELDGDGNVLSEFES